MTVTIQKALLEIIQRIKSLSVTPFLDAQVLLAHTLGQPRSWVMAHPEYVLNDRQFQSLDRDVNRLEGGEALPYVIGHWEFFSLDFYVTRDVLIPRPETELLVERGIEWLRLHSQARKAIDIGTGSGCIGISLATHISDLMVLLTDVSSAALEVARINADQNNLCDRLEFQQADLLEGVDGSFDLICANLPYIPSQTLRALDVFKKEPRQALDGGKDGTSVIARLLEQARNVLTPGGLMLLEIEATQGDQVKSLAQHLYPASKIRILKDLSDRDRCVQVERSRLIVHLCQRNEWLKAQEQGILVAESLAREGFIHNSTPEQILWVANSFYRGDNDLILLWIDPALVTSEIRWEMVESSLFPHIYGPINLPAVVNITEMESQGDGSFSHLVTPV